MKQNDIYQMVTDSVIELLENHELEGWKKPWIALGADNAPARNATTDKNYRGVNQFMLGMSLSRKGYLKNQWLTFKQAKDKGANIKKGEKSTPIVFSKPAYVGENNKFIPAEKMGEQTEEQIKAQGLKKIFMLKLYRVFNVAQTEGLDPHFYEVEPQEPLQDFEKDERAENLIKATNAEIEITESNRAYYDPANDKIKLPLREQFKGTQPFYGTALHELGHWTAHSTRLNRDLKGSVGDASHAKEELIAELSSAFVCASLGFSKTITNNAAYLKNWLGVLKKDNKAIVRASAQAQKAADYILAFTPNE